LEADDVVRVERLAGVSDVLGGWDCVFVMSHERLTLQIHADDTQKVQSPQTIIFGLELSDCFLGRPDRTRTLDTELF
jgi:hypothetical protein